MTKDDPQNILKKNLRIMREQRKRHEQAEIEIEKDESDDSSNISGPKDELEYHRMKKDIKDSCDEK